MFGFFSPSADCDRIPDPSLLIRNVLTIGGVFDPETGLLCERDRWMQRHGAALARRAGFRFSHDVQRRNVNLHYGEDFLDLPYPCVAEMVIAMALYDSPNAKLHSDKMISELMPDCFVSPYHNEKGAWARAAKNVGAKIIVTMTNMAVPQEIDVTHFSELQFFEGPSSSHTYRHGRWSYPILLRSIFDPNLG